MTQRLVDHLDKGASLGPDRPCLTVDGESLTYADVVALSHQVAWALARVGVGPGDKVAILSANDPVSFACVFGISRAGAVWCPVNPRNEAAENRDLLDQLDVTVLLHQAAFAPLVEAIAGDLVQLTTVVCFDGPPAAVDVAALTFAAWVDRSDATPFATPASDGAPAMIAGTGGTTGRPKGVQLSGRALEAMTAATLIGYPFGERPTYLAFAPLTHAAGVLCLPMMRLGGEIVVMRGPDVAELLRLVPAHCVTHLFLPPTVIYMVLDHPDLDATDLSSLECLWYGAAPMSVDRLAQAVRDIGPVMAQLYGQTEAPMMISTMAPADHLRPDDTPAVERFGSAGRPSPMVSVAILGEGGTLLPAGERGEIVVRGALVMDGYYRNPEATAEATVDGWHRTGDIGYLDDDGWLWIVDRAKDMIITGGYNVYSAEVEQALMAHPAVRDCAVVGLPDDKWGERVSAVLEVHDGVVVDADLEADVIAFVKARIGSVKTPKQVAVWPELPRSKVGKVLKPDVRSRLAE